MAVNDIINVPLERALERWRVEYSRVSALEITLIRARESNDGASLTMLTARLDSARSRCAEAKREYDQLNAADWRAKA